MMRSALVAAALAAAACVKHQTPPRESAAAAGDTAPAAAPPSAGEPVDTGAATARRRHEAPASSDETRGQRFVIIYRPGPAWRAGRRVTEQDLGSHFAFIRTLFEAGRVTLAGPFLDDSGGMAVLRARDRADAERVLAADPAVTSGVMIGELRPYHAAFDEARAPAVRGR